jgi:hypothetical protein
MKKNEQKPWTLAKLARKQLNEDSSVEKASMKEVARNEPNFRGSALNPMPYTNMVGAHKRSFKESVLIGQFKAKLKRKEIKTEDVPPAIMNAIIADTVAQGKAALKQANQFVNDQEDNADHNALIEATLADVPEPPPGSIAEEGWQDFEYNTETKAIEHIHSEHCKHD